MQFNGGGYISEMKKRINNVCSLQDGQDMVLECHEWSK